MLHPHQIACEPLPHESPALLPTLSSWPVCPCSSLCNTERLALEQRQSFPSVDTLDLFPPCPFPVPHCVPCNRDVPFAWGTLCFPREHKTSHPFPSSRPRSKKRETDRYNATTGTGFGRRRKEGRGKTSLRRKENIASRETKIRGENKKKKDKRIAFPLGDQISPFSPHQRGKRRMILDARRQTGGYQHEVCQLPNPHPCVYSTGTSTLSTCCVYGFTILPPFI